MELVFFALYLIWGKRQTEKQKEKKIIIDIWAHINKVWAQIHVTTFERRKTPELES